jgi:hypothetical protein
MMRNILIIPLFLLTSLTTYAHYLWLETDAIAELGRVHEIRVHFGEYTYGVIETVQGEAFPAVAQFELWLIAPDGTKTLLVTEAREDFYMARFTPEQPGTYTAALNNNEIEVIDYTQYDFGIFKTHYHATARILAGKEEEASVADNPQGIVIKQLVSANEETRLQVLYKGKPLPENELKVYVADLWSKTLETDADGIVTFGLPWDTKYIVESTIKEEVPGTYKGKPYEFIWHCATYCIRDASE